MKNFELVKDAISGELETKNNRINWLLISQSFIFVAFGVIQRTLANTEEISPLSSLSPLIPIFGVFISTLTLLGISGCYRAIYVLSKQYESAIENVGEEGIDKTVLEKLIYKDEYSKWIGIIYSYLMCLGILLLWVYAHKFL